MFVNEDIREIEKGVYLVHGKVIKEVFPGQYDSNEGHDELVRLATTSCCSQYTPKAYGDLTVFSFRPLASNVRGARYRGSSQWPFSSLSDDAREILRKEFPAHATEI